ncbi:hypothetical protein ACU81Q_06100 [Komagataeibacter melomenusus]
MVLRAGPLCFSLLMSRHAPKRQLRLHGTLASAMPAQTPLHY